MYSNTHSSFPLTRLVHFLEREETTIRGGQMEVFNDCYNTLIYLLRPENIGHRPYFLSILELTTTLVKWRHNRAVLRNLTYPGTNILLGADHAHLRVCLILALCRMIDEQREKWSKLLSSSTTTATTESHELLLRDIEFLVECVFHCLTFLGAGVSTYPYWYQYVENASRCRKHPWDVAVVAKLLQGEVEGMTLWK